MTEKTGTTIRELVFLSQRFSIDIEGKQISEVPIPSHEILKGADATPTGL